MCVDQVVAGDLEQCAPIHAERLDELSLAVLDRCIHVGRRNVDEPRGQIGHQPVELAAIPRLDARARVPIVSCQDVMQVHGTPGGEHDWSPGPRRAVGRS
jgi:hypothetical protein